jgi:hypothetical protein
MLRSFSSMFLFLGTITLAISVSGTAYSAEPTSKKAKTTSAKEEAIEEVELFQAIEAKQVSVDFLPKDATQATIIFHNETKKPLKIKLPDTFGAVHVLAQLGGGMGGMGGGMGGMGGGGMGGGGMGGGGMGGGQGMGGGMGGGGMGGGGMGGGGMGGGGMGGGGMGGGGMGGMGGGGGLFRVEPDQPRKLRVHTVCLEHGKKDPNPRMKYKLVRIEEVDGGKEVEQVCRLLGYNQVNQNVAQAIAWHYTDGMSWMELAHKPRMVSQYTGIELFFSEYEIQAAMRLAGRIETHVASTSSSSVPGNSGGSGR